MSLTNCSTFWGCNHNLSQLSQLELPLEVILTYILC